MNDLRSIDTSECQWILNTYRIGMIPEPTRLRLTREYQLVNGALALPHGDARLSSGDNWSQLAHHEIRSFWW